MTNVYLTGLRLPLIAQGMSILQSAAASSNEAAASQPAAAVTAAPPEMGHDNPLWQALRNNGQLTLQDVLKPSNWIDTIRDLVVSVVGFVPRLIVAVLFLFIFWLVYRAIRRVLLGSMMRANVDQSIRDMLGALLKWAIMGFGLVIACNQVGIQITALLAGVSIIGLAVGFAAQETLANFIAGVVIFWDKPFKVGEWITVDEIFSRVLRVTFRSTRLLTLDGETVVFPNTYMLANKVLNHSAHPMNRINVAIGIAYKASIDDARGALLALTTHDSRLCNSPSPQVVVTECADSSVNLILQFWIRDESIEKAIQCEYLEKAKKALDAAGIDIPFPHMQLLLENTEAVNTLAGKPRVA
jgi:small conductance mechanosensitive channel